MYPAARVNASIELFAECRAAWGLARPQPADIIINRYFRARRYIGSKDRGAIAALCYLIIRNYAGLAWHIPPFSCPGEARALAIAALMLIEGKTLPDVHNIFNGEHFCPAKMEPLEKELAKALAGKEFITENMPDHVRYNYPETLDEAIKSAFKEGWQQEMEALSQEAPVDLRANTLLTTREHLLEALLAEQFEVGATPFSLNGIRLKKRAPIFTSQYFKQGWFEMQDEGSQLVTQMITPLPGQKVIDFCAGAGGKTLAIAAMMQNKGRIMAFDISKNRLDQMRERLRRAKVDNVQIHALESAEDSFLKRHRDSAHHVIVDAPCSGSGTWRRNPDLKWRCNSEAVKELTQIQEAILLSSSRLVKTGGHLLYITCSIFPDENEKIVDVFLQQKKNFKVVMPENLCSKLTQKISDAGGYLRLSPALEGTDGFFAVLLQRLE